MELVVDLERVTVVLADGADAGDVCVRVGAPSGASPTSEADVHRLNDVLTAAYVGRLDGPHDAVVRADAVRFHAAGQVDEGWEDRFDRLCVERAAGSAASPGAGRALRAPVRWPDAGAGAAPAADPLSPSSSPGAG